MLTDDISDLPFFEVGRSSAIGSISQMESPILCGPHTSFHSGRQIHTIDPFDLYPKISITVNCFILWETTCSTKLVRNMEELKLERVRNRLLYCPVCLDEFEDPRWLPCLHTVCYQCLQQLKDSSSSVFIQCPECRSNISTRENCFFYVTDINSRHMNIFLLLGSIVSVFFCSRSNVGAPSNTAIITCDI
ncbi:unnamed protein product [Acanthosepion pharaonis]|uniref:RING-type domain-containing protein n=1 Tax=Acanthosepion pharaonis TaxID=158019 RepID=A0A812ANI4_ACAPH|nr:unnamed protein product [Sepia pharaonis]